MSFREFDKLCQQAKLAIASRDWGGAKEAYLKALQIKSDVPDVHQGVATIYFQMREYANAAHHFREVTQLDPLRAGAFINLGAVLNLLAEHEQAVTALRRGIQLDPKRAEGFYNLGLVYRRQGQTKLAMEAYREAVRVNPNMADAHYNLANIYVEREEYKQAIRSYREALKTRPNWEKALDSLSQAEEALEREESADVGFGEEPVPQSSSITMRFGKEIDLSRMVNPEVHGSVLDALHQATIDSQTQGTRMLDHVIDEVEPLIKELSACLLYPSRSPTSLDQCIQKFESALAQAKGVHQKLRDSILRAQSNGQKLAES